MGVEPTTLGLLDPRSNQLSYEGYTFDTHGCDLYLLHTSVTLPLSNLPSHPPTHPATQPPNQPPSQHVSPSGCAYVEELVLVECFKQKGVNIEDEHNQMH